MKRKITFIVLLCIIFISFSIKINADDSRLAASISTNKEKYNVGDIVEVKIKTNKNVISSSFYLSYNSSYMEFKKVKSPNSVAVKNYPADNLLRVIYADLGGVGISEMIFEFNVKSSTTNTLNFALNNTSMTLDNNKSFNQDTIDGINSIATISVVSASSNNNTNNANNASDIANSNTNINTNTNSSDVKTYNSNTKNYTNSNSINNNTTSKKTDNTTTNNNIPKTGINKEYLLFSILIIISVVLGIKYKIILNCFKY